MSSETTARRFLRSTGAATIAQFWRVVVIIGTNILLRRLIAPEDWGLWFWVENVFVIASALRDLGLPSHLLRLRQGRPYGNLLAVEVIWGAALVALVYVAAPIGAYAYKDWATTPWVVPVIRAMALFLFLEGLAVVPATYFDAELKIGRAVLPEILRNLTFAGLAIGLAAAGHGVGSLIVANIASVGVYALLLWVRAIGHMPLHFSHGQTLKLLKSSYALAFIWMLGTLVTSVHIMILGARFESDLVGIYGFAFQTAFLVMRTLLPPVGRALYPALVHFGAAPGAQFRPYRLATLFLMAMEVPAAYFLFVNAEFVVKVLAGGKWAGAEPYLRLLCFLPLVDPLSRFGAKLLMARHQDRLRIVSSLATLVSFVGLGFLLTGLLGPVGMVATQYLPLGSFLMAWGVYQAAPGEFRLLLKELALIYLVPLPLLAAAHVLGGPSIAARLLLSLAALGLTYLVYYKRFGADFVSFFRSAPPAAV